MYKYKNDFIKRWIMCKFDNKTVFFIGDSNISRPYFLEYLRADFINTGKTVYLYNKGIAGARMDMVLNSIDEEIAVLKPDYAALSFGGNDLGIWLYDATLPVTEELIDERESRIESYCIAFKKVITYLRGKGIEPILMTPLCYDENIIEKDGIETQKDNKEKTQIKQTLFTKASFKNINENGLKVICERGKRIAAEYGVTVWDLYSYTKTRIKNSDFNSDGVHYNEHGHRIIAESIYTNMFGEKMGDYAIDERIKAISALENDERAYFFIKYNLVFLSEGRRDGEELIKSLNRFIEKKGYVEGLTESRVAGFFRFMSDPTKNTEQITHMVMRLFENR